MEDVNWDGYELHQPVDGANRPLHEVPRDVARKEYERLMAERARRLNMLQHLLSANGVSLEGGDWLDELEAWYVSHVQEDPAEPGRLLPRWYSVTKDIGLLLGEQLIAVTGQQLHWGFVDWGGKRNVAYQRAVLMGFSTPNPRYNVDTDLVVAGLGHRAIKNRRADGTFKRVYQGALDFA